VPRYSIAVSLTLAPDALLSLKLAPAAPNWTQSEPNPLVTGPTIRLRHIGTVLAAAMAPGRDPLAERSNPGDSMGKFGVPPANSGVRLPMYHQAPYLAAQHQREHHDRRHQPGDAEQGGDDPSPGGAALEGDQG
jgi:hypothetical protein